MNPFRPFVQQSRNGHYYELVIDDLQATFDGAVAAAASRRGGKGYLATVT